MSATEPREWNDRAISVVVQSLQDQATANRDGIAANTKAIVDLTTEMKLLRQQSGIVIASFNRWALIAGSAAAIVIAAAIGILLLGGGA